MFIFCETARTRGFQLFFASPVASLGTILRVSDQNGVSLLYIMLDIHHSGRDLLVFNNSNEHISRAPLHVKHAQLR